MEAVLGPKRGMGDDVISGAQTDESNRSTLHGEIGPRSYALSTLGRRREHEGRRRTAGG